MRTSIAMIGETLVVVAKFDNSDIKKSWTVDELIDTMSGMIDAYGFEDEDEEVMYAVMGALKATAIDLDEGTILSHEDK